MEIGLEQSLRNSARHLQRTRYSGEGHWGILETAKPKKKINENRKTAQKFGQNRKPHLLSK